MKKHPIKQWREERDATQQEAAGYFGVSRWAVNRIEQGERNPGIELSQRIAKVTGIELHKLRPDVWSKKRNA